MAVAWLNHRVQRGTLPPINVVWNLPVRCLGCCQAPQQALYPPSWSPFAGRNRLGMVVAVVSGMSSPTANRPTISGGIASNCAPLFPRPLLWIPFFGGRGRVRPTPVFRVGLSFAPALYINRARIHIILHNTRCCQACLLPCKRAATRPFFRSQSALRFRSAE